MPGWGYSRARPRDQIAGSNLRAEPHRSDQNAAAPLPVARTRTMAAPAARGGFVALPCPVVTAPMLVAVAVLNLDHAVVDLRARAHRKRGRARYRHQ